MLQMGKNQMFGACLRVTQIWDALRIVLQTSKGKEYSSQKLITAELGEARKTWDNVIIFKVK